MFKKIIFILIGVLIFAVSFALITQKRFLPESGIRSSEEGEDAKLEAAYIQDAMRWYYRQRAYPGTSIPDGWREKAMSQMEKTGLAKTSGAPISWKSVGPNNVGGRTRTIAIDPNNHNIIYAGAVSGGVWKSTDAGATWTPKSDFAQNLIVSSIAIDPANSNIVYAATGEGYFNYDALRGSGLMKSTDGGDSWTTITSFSPLGGYKYYYIFKIALKPGSSSVLYAAMIGGAYRSTDAGANWTKMTVPSTSTFCMDIVPDPTNTATVYVAFGFDLATPSHDGIYKSTNSGQTWSKIANGFPTAGYGRISLAISPSNSQVLYACLSDSATSGTYGIEKTTNGGASWAAVATPMDNTGAVNGTHLGNQGWYNNIIKVDPTDPNIVYTGGINLFKTINGGTNWNRLTDGYSSPYVHVDQHEITFDPTNHLTVYFGCDGGIFKTTDGGTSFTSNNTNYITAQFYSSKIHPLVDIRIGGSQDNGTLKSNTSATGTQIFGGDGGYTAIDFNTPTTYYTEYVYLSIRKTTNGSAVQPTFSKVLNGIPAGSNQSDGTTDRCAFIAPFVMDPTTPTTLVAGTFKLYRTTNSAGSWTAITNDITGDGDGSGQVGSQASVVSAIAVAPSNSFIIYAGTSGSGAVASKVWKISFSTSWVSTEITKNTLPNRYVSTIAVNPTDNTNIYVGYQGYNANTPVAGHVFKSTNSGTTWTNISGDLPDVPVNKVLLQPDNVNHILAGTDLGVFETFNGGTNWVSTSGAMPNVPVFDLDLRASDNIVLAGTHGRGMFQSTTPMGVTMVSDNIPSKYSLGQNYPNPFNPATTIPFTLSGRAHVQVSIYDAVGRLVTTLVDREMAPGSYTTNFDASQYSSGVYFYRLTTSGEVAMNEMKKMMLIK